MAGYTPVQACALPPPRSCCHQFSYKRYCHGSCHIICFAVCKYQCVCYKKDCAGPGKDCSLCGYHSPVCYGCGHVSCCNVSAHIKGAGAICAFDYCKLHYSWKGRGICAEKSDYAVYYGRHWHGHRFCLEPCCNGTYKRDIWVWKHTGYQASGCMV